LKTTHLNLNVWKGLANDQTLAETSSSYQEEEEEEEE
jgi:hypothetical protein